MTGTTTIILGMNLFSNPVLAETVSSTGADTPKKLVLLAQMVLVRAVLPVLKKERMLMKKINQPQKMEKNNHLPNLKTSPLLTKCLRMIGRNVLKTQVTRIL